MKRLYLHLLFWSFFIAVCIFIEYLWEKASIPQYTARQLIVSATNVTFVEILPEILFTYYIAFYGLSKFVTHKRNIILLLIEVLIILFACMLLERMLSIYIVTPYLYHNLIPAAPLLDIRKLFIVLLYMMFASGLMIAIKSVRLQLASKEREKNLLREKLEAELKFLRNQVNPHFLFNTLNNIYGLTRKKSDKAPEVVMKLSAMLNFMLYESGKEFISIAEEIKLLENYIELERIRYSERLTVQFNKDIDNQLQPVSPLLLLPLVENAFKHGISETRFSSFVTINMTLKDAKLSFTIENSVENGKTKTPNSNIGLTNIRRQLELMYKQYTIDTVMEYDIFKALITINLDSYGNN